MVVSRQDLAQLMADGWTDPRSHYLPLLRPRCGVRTRCDHVDGKCADDLVIWVDIEPDMKPAEKQRQFIHEVGDFDTGYLQSISDLSQEGVATSWTSSSMSISSIR